MLSKLEAVQIFNDPVFTFTITIVTFLESSLQLLQELDLNLGIVYIKLFVLAYFGGDNSLVAILHIHALDDLPESPVVNDFGDFVAIAQVLTNLSYVVAFLISD